MLENTPKDTPLKSGGYNNVTKTYAPRDNDDTFPWKVLKRPLDSDDVMSKAQRAVDKWNLINPKFTAWVVDDGCWMVPYLGDVCASDKQIALKVLDIYRNTRNIIADACGPGNFLRYEEETVCVDVDLACKIRRGSIASDDFFRCVIKSDKMSKYWSYFKKDTFKPNTVDMIETLFFLEDCLEIERICNEFLTPEVILCCTEYRKKNMRVSPHIINKICNELNISFQLKSPLFSPQLSLNFFEPDEVTLFQPTRLTL